MVVPFFFVYEYSHTGGNFPLPMRQVKHSDYDSFVTDSKEKEEEEEETS